MGDKSYTLTEEQFQQLLATAAKTAQPQAPQPGVSALTPDEQVALLVKQVKEGEHREVHKIEEVACTSTETEATFVAVIATSKAFPKGRVVSLKDYRYPPGTDTHKVDGGLVPEGMTISLKDGTQTKEYKQWRWEFWKTDLKRYVGQDAAWLKRMADIARASEEPATV